MTSPKNFLRVELTDEQQQFIEEMRKTHGKGFISKWIRNLIDKEISEDADTLKVKEAHYQSKLEEIRLKKDKLIKKEENITQIEVDKKVKAKEFAWTLVLQAKEEPDQEKAMILCVRAYRGGITLKQMKPEISLELHQLVLKKLTGQVR